ncbi:hypothetical protein tb265_28390 [Gemmatimonadetes bacterium T265]|nr:hypothetical protein tb265_28390 [Gemmatimonadetes bacterium T265]
MAAAVVAAGPRRAAAQGSLSGQGFGYPPGELSTRALGMGGGIAEFDPVSPINPASLASYGRTGFAFQYDPEFRTTQVDGRTAHNTIARFPVVAIGVPFRQRFTFGFSASTFLDRSFTTQYPDTTSIGGQNVLTNEAIESRGSISDLRLGLGAYVAPWLRVGAAVHRLTGRNRLVTGRSFADTTQFGAVSDSSTLSYTGSAVSVGAEVTPVRGFSIAGSARRGGRLRAERNDTVVARADTPDRLGIGVRIDRITGASISASYARTNWSSMRGLGSSTLDARDTHELMGGVEALGPSLGSTPVILRAGARRRTLPFGIDGAQIRETAYTGGLGLPFAGGRAIGDLALQRSIRDPEAATTALQNVRERAWTLSLGFTLRP